MNNAMIDGITNIDEDLIEKYFKLKAKYAKKLPRNTRNIAKWSSIAASISLFILAGFIFISLMNQESPPLLQSIERPYTDANITVNETPIVWPWNYKTIFEKYETIDIDGIKYTGYMQEITENHIGNKINSYEATGYDDTSESVNGIYHQMFDAYEIKDVSPNRLIAVKMDDKYYVFGSELYFPPETWGGVLADYGLLNAVEFKSFSRKNANGELEYYSLDSDAVILDILNTCLDAKAVDPIGWHQIERDGINFSVTSEILGVYKKTISITDDGYLWTDMFNGEYLYYIGIDVSNEIITHAVNNSKIVENVTNEKFIVGNVVEITNEYILVDDSVMCKSPDDGMVFKVLLNDIRVRRYIEMNIIEVGDTVQIIYGGLVDIRSGNVIDSAISALKATILEKNTMIPE